WEVRFIPPAASTTLLPDGVGAGVAPPSNIASRRAPLVVVRVTPARDRRHVLFADRAEELFPRDLAEAVGDRQRRMSQHYLTVPIPQRQSGVRQCLRELADLEPLVNPNLHDCPPDSCNCVHPSVSR